MIAINSQELKTLKTLKSIVQPVQLVSESIQILQSKTV